MANKILVIKHGALGDFILATGAIQAIRNHHPDAHITLLTTKPMVGLAKQMNVFDDIWADPRAKWLDYKTNWKLIKALRASKFARVYDLQTSDRSNMYFRLMGLRKPEWNGNIEWCSHPYASKDRENMHTLNRLATQLQVAGIERVPLPSVDFLESDIGKFNLPERYVLVVPGGSAHRTEKRWHDEGFAQTCEWLYSQHKARAVLIGTEAERTMLDAVQGRLANFEPINLMGKTTFADIAELARGAMMAIGNDTGPMHIIAAAHCPSVIIYSGHSDPALIAPKSDRLYVIQRAELRHLESREVIDSVEELLEMERPLDSSVKTSQSAPPEAAPEPASDQPTQQ